MDNCSMATDGELRAIARGLLLKEGARLWTALPSTPSTPSRAILFGELGEGEVLDDAHRLAFWSARMESGLPPRRLRSWIVASPWRWRSMLRLLSDGSHGVEAIRAWCWGELAAGLLVAGWHPLEVRERLASLGADPAHPAYQLAYGAAELALSEEH